MVDPVFLHFEITQDRTVLFYLGLFTSVLAVSRGMIPQDTKVFSPEELITEVVAHTHYMPDEWSDKLHSQAVSRGFKFDRYTEANDLQSSGPCRIRQAVRDEAVKLSARTHLCSVDTLHPRPLPAPLGGRHRGLFPRVYGARRWDRVCLFFRRLRL